MLRRTSTDVLSGVDPLAGLDYPACLDISPSLNAAPGTDVCLFRCWRWPNSDRERFGSPLRPSLLLWTSCQSFIASKSEDLPLPFGPHIITRRAGTGSSTVNSVKRLYWLRWICRICILLRPCL